MGGSREGGPLGQDPPPFEGPLNLIKRTKKCMHVNASHFSRVTWGKMTTGLRFHFIIIWRPPASSCVCLMCGHLEDDPRHLTSQQKQSSLSSQISFSFTPSHVKNGSMYQSCINSRKSQETMGLFD